MEAEIDSRICKASAAFQSLSRILWYQRRIQTSSKLRILNSVILPTLFYGLESTVLLQLHVRRRESFVIRCLRIILGLTVRQKKHHHSQDGQTTKDVQYPCTASSSIPWSYCQNAQGSLSKAASCVCSSGW